MNGTRRSTRRSSRLALLIVALLALRMGGVAELATDLGGDLRAVEPEPTESSIAEFMQAEPVEPVNMNSADVVIGYVDADTHPAISPLTCVNRSLISLNQLLYEPLVDLDASMKPTPMLADNWEQNGRYWRFTLRSGITFHNGAELTAYDVVLSYQMLRMMEDGPYSARLDMIRDMKVSDDDIYAVIVEAKNSSWLTLYAMNFPVMQYTTVNDEIPMGTGPYWFIEYAADGTMRLEANPLWWKQQPGVHSVLAKRYANSGDAIEALQTNEINMLCSESSKAALSRKLADLTSLDYSTTTYELLFPNMSSGAVMADLAARQAVMYAIDRSNLASSAYVDMAVPCEVPVSPSSWLYEGQSAVFYYSPERALYLMQSLGWEDLTGDGRLNQLHGIMLSELNVRIITYNDSADSVRENAANLIADSLNAVGFNASVEVMTLSSLRSAIKSGDYDLALVGVNLSEVPLLSSLLSSSGSLNLNKASDSTLNALLERVSSASTEEELKSVMSEIQMRVVEQLPFLGMCFRTGTVLANRSLSGMSGMHAYDALNGFEFLEG